MNLPETSRGAPEETLVGSLAAFSLSEILPLLAWTGQTGEFQVTSDILDGQLWLTEGRLSDARVDTTSSIGEAVFELACLSEGTFSFTPGILSSSGRPAVAVDSVLDEVRPQVDEWRKLRTTLPLDVVVTLSPTPPGRDIQITSEQWQVLTTVGTTGLAVRTVLTRIGGDQIAGLRTLCDLHAIGLIVIGTVTSAGDGTEESAEPPRDHSEPITVVEDLVTVPEPSDSPDTESFGDCGESTAVDDPEKSGSDTLAGVTIMPPPIATDPWAPTVQSSGSASNGSGDSGAA
ncbi:MAG: DUF4388 domain-containing protein [Acidimicrobiales bacterium]